MTGSRNLTLVITVGIQASHSVLISKPVIRTKIYWLRERLGQLKEYSYNFCYKSSPGGYVSFHQGYYNLRKNK